MRLFRLPRDGFRSRWPRRSMRWLPKSEPLRVSSKGARSRHARAERGPNHVCMRLRVLFADVAAIAARLQHVKHKVLVLSGKVNFRRIPADFRLAHIGENSSPLCRCAVRVVENMYRRLHAAAAQGGVGKSTFSAQLAWALSGMDKQVSR